MFTMESISHAELLSLWKRGMRNGAFRRMPLLKRGLFSAALEYTRTVGTIVNQKLIGMIMALADRIGKSLGRRIFLHGLGRASGFIQNGSMMRAFSAVRKWINEDSFVFWLGTDMLARRTWILAAEDKPNCQMQTQRQRL